MPDMVTDLLRIQLKTIQPILKRSGVNKMRSWQDAIGALMVRTNMGRAELFDVTFPDFAARLAAPLDMPTEGVILYLHGGGYVAGSLDYAMGFGSELSCATGMRVLCPAYRLAPEYRFPAAVDDSFESYKYLLRQGFEEKRIIICGESAGGGLVFSLVQKLLREGYAGPAGLIGISPWSDLTMSGVTIQTNEKNDPSLNVIQLEKFAAFYTDDRKNPLVSPLFGDFTGAPRSLIFAGGDEILLDDSVRLAQRLHEFGCECELVVEEKMWHVYPLYGTRPAKAAMERIVSFVGELITPSAAKATEKEPPAIGEDAATDTGR